MKLKIGQIAPLFSLKNTDDKTVNLKDYRNLNVVLYFYPKDNTPGCTIEAKEFTSDLKEFEKYSMPDYLKQSPASSYLE